jgi:pilus assembly protein CpaF
MSDVDVPFHAIRDQVNSAIDVIVQLTRTYDGTRRVTEVSFVTSRRKEDFVLETLMRWDPDLLGANGAHGGFERFPLPEQLLRRLRHGRQEQPENWGEPR